MNPKVSVVLSVWNGEKYIKDAVESILNQTFENFEFIIINDGSTDNTSLILLQYKDPRIIRLENEKNLGLVKSLNFGLKVARGEFIARMDADDISHRERLQKQVNYLDSHKEIGVLGTGMEQASLKGKIISTFSPPLDHHEILLAMFTETPIAHATVMMRRDILREANGYNETFPHVEDTELWSRLILSTRFANLPEVLYTRRIHSDSIMGRYAPLQREREEEIKDRLLETLALKHFISENDFFKIKAERARNRSPIKKLFRKLKDLLPIEWRHRVKNLLHLP